MYISESGADSFNNNTQSVNESQQALATEQILNTVLSYSDLCVGITLFEFCDEWWKAGDPNTQDPGGFPISVAYDNFANEEYWGIVKRDRSKKESFYVVQEIYGNQLSSVNLDELQMKIFPNPTTSDFITIQTMFNGVKYVELFDINGRLLLNKILKTDYLNIDSLDPGMYFVKVTVEGKFSTSKLIVH